MLQPWLRNDMDGSGYQPNLHTTSWGGLHVLHSYFNLAVPFISMLDCRIKLEQLIKYLAYISLFPFVVF